MTKKKYNISIVGLGYVGLPLALELGKKYPTIGYDINKKRIETLKKNIDLNNEVKKFEFIKSKKLKFTTDNSKLSNSNIYIITLPTPINKKKKPELMNLKYSIKIISKMINKNDIIIFESTFFPGLTDEICIPLIEKYSNLKINKDFGVGYSPERINPGDPKNKLINIVKVVSASNNKTLKIINTLYKSIIKAGTYPVSSIKIAEAAKIIENTQRDINIAFVNHLKSLFDKLNINSNEIFNAAATKWNYLDFRPGLVGGHCIGVDPYYLADKAKKSGFNPNFILASKKINDSMPKYFFNQFLNLFIKNNINKNKSRILLLGVTFKENCNDIRNSKVFEIINSIKKNFHSIDVVDPHADINEVYANHKLKLLVIAKLNLKKYDGIFIAVPHKIFSKLKLKESIKKNCIIYDIKSIYSEN